MGTCLSRKLDQRIFSQSDRVKRVLSLIKRIRSISRVEWGRPPITDLLIYQNNDAIEPLVKLLSEGTYNSFDPSASVLNIYVLWHTIRNRRFSLVGYCASFVRLSKPRVVLTMMDNDTNFYQLKVLCPEQIFIGIQNGLRGNISPTPNTGFFDLMNLLKQRKKLSVDHLFVFGPAIVNSYRQITDGEITPHGSLINNFQKPFNRRPKPTRLKILLLSSLPSTDPSSEEKFSFFGSTPMTYREYFEAEGLVANYLSDYCQKNNYHLTILGKRPGSTTFEEQFFRDRIGSSNWTFVPRQSTTSNYVEVDKGDVIVAIDSTLGYECLARGHRVAFLSIRLDRMKRPDLERIQDFDFGFPSDLGDQGPFWTNKSNESDFDRVLSFCCNASWNDWDTASQAVRDLIMIHNPGNTKLLSVLTSLGVKMKK